MSIVEHDNKFLRIRKWSAGLLMLALLATVIAGYGCAPGAKSLALQISKVDSTGLTIVLAPKDNNNQMVIVEGRLSAELYLQLGAGDNVTRGALIEEWNDIPVAGKDYVEPEGAIIDLKYSVPHVFEPGASCGILDVSLNLPGGVLAAEARDITLIGEGAG